MMRKNDKTVNNGSIVFLKIYSTNGNILLSIITSIFYKNVKIKLPGESAKAQTADSKNVFFAATILLTM